MVVLILLNYVGKAVVLLLYLAKKLLFFSKNCEEKKVVKIRFGYFTTKKG